MDERVSGPIPGQGCAICGESGVAGDLALRREVFNASGATWQVVQPLLAAALCRGCFARANSLAAIAADPARQLAGMLGVPPAVSGGGVLNGRQCDYCKAEVGTEAYGLELLPRGRTFVRTSLFRHTGEIRQQRLCLMCYGWWRATLFDTSAVSGTGVRRLEGPTGGWLSTVAFPTCGVGLHPRDAFTIARVLEPFAIPLVDLPGGAVPAGYEGQVVFIAADRHAPARDVIRALSPAERTRTVLVGRLDCLDDVRECLRLGVSELLASPLSPQQVEGAFHRVSHEAAPAIDPVLGLPLLRDGQPRFGLPAQHFRVAGPGDDALALALILRRFVRGYDRIGGDGEGGVVLCVYCEDEHVPAVLRRLKTVLGERTVLTPMPREEGDRAAA